MSSRACGHGSRRSATSARRRARTWFRGCVSSSGARPSPRSSATCPGATPAACACSCPTGSGTAKAALRCAGAGRRRVARTITAPTASIPAACWSIRTRPRSPRCSTTRATTPRPQPWLRLRHDSRRSSALTRILDSYELSPLQAGLLFQALRETDRATYVEQIVVALEEQIDVPRLLRAWEQVVARHTILRTRFRWEGLAQPVQEVLDVARMPVERLEGPLEEILQEQRARGFDLT